LSAPIVLVASYSERGALQSNPTHVVGTEDFSQFGHPPPLEHGILQKNALGIRVTGTRSRRSNALQSSALDNNVPHPRPT
jgi:hypothetical protein